MSRPITADLRRESIDLLAVGGAINDKLYVSSAGEETVPLRTVGQDANRGDEFILQNGHRTKDLLGRPLSKTRWSSHSEKYRRLQNYCYRFLEMPRGWCVTYHALLFFLVIGSLILTALSTVKTDKENYETILHTPIFIVEVILIIIFLLEYIIRLWSAGCRSAYVGFRGRLHFAVKLYAVLDMIVIVSSIVAVSMASNVSTSPIRLLRFLPLLRVLRFDRQGGTWKLLGSVIYVHRQELLTTFYLGFISLIFASFVLYMAEKDTNTDFRSWPSSFWWGIVTLTTVGYGDSVPESWYGKFCASLFALCGISFFALPAGILGSGFALKVTQQQRQKHFHRRRRPAAILLQSYWRVFCADLNSKSVATWFPHIYYSRQQHQLRNCVTADSRCRFGSCSSHDAIVTMFSQHNIHCSVLHPRKGSNATSGWGDESAVIAFQEGENPSITLSNAQKLAIRLIRILKLRVAIRKFKEARRPYDVKDVIEQYSTGHVEMLARVKSLQAKLDKALGHRMEEDGDHAGKLGVDGRLARVEHQVSVLDTKLELVLQLLQQIRGAGGPSSEGSQSYELSFRRDGDGISTRRSSVSRAYSDPLDGRVHVEPNRVSTHVVRTSDIPCVTLSDPESVQSSFPYYDRSQGSRPSSLTSNSAQSQSGSDQVLNLDQSDVPYPSESATLNPFPNTRALLPDKRQLSDVTEADESLTDSKETVGGLTPSAPISQQNSTASDADTGDQEASPGRSANDVTVWEKREPAPSELDSRRRRPSIQETPLLEVIRKRLSDEEDERENSSQQEHDSRRGDAQEWTPVRITDSPTANRSALRRSSPVHSEEEPDKNNSEKGPFDASVRSAPTRLSAKRRPLIKSTPVEV